MKAVSSSYPCVETTASCQQLDTMAVWLIYLGVLGSWMTLRSSSTKCHWMQIHQSGTVCLVLAEFMATYS
jgi:uncharacterized membrane protein HdeD (DUF308 family)